MRQIFFDDELQQDLVQKGYAVVPLLARDEAAQLIPEIDEILRGYDFTDESRFQYYPNHVSFLSSNVAYKRRVVELVERVMALRLSRFVADYRTWAQSFYIKPPGGPVKDRHEKERQRQRDIDALPDVVVKRGPGREQ